MKLVTFYGVTQYCNVLFLKVTFPNTDNYFYLFIYLLYCFYFLTIKPIADDKTCPSFIVHFLLWFNLDWVCYGPTETRDVRIHLRAFITKRGRNRHGSNSGKQVHSRQDKEYSRDRQGQLIGKHNPVSKGYPNKQAIVQTWSKQYPNKGEMSGVIHSRQ